MTDLLDVRAKAISDAELAHTFPTSSLELHRQEFEAWRYRVPWLGYSRGIRFYFAIRLLELAPGDHVADIGGYDGAFQRVASTEGALCTVVDKTWLSPTVQVERGLRCDVLELDRRTLPASKILLDHTFEHFEGETDRTFVNWLGAWLPKGNVCCIEPLFIGQRYLEVFKEEREYIYDPLAELIPTTVSHFPGLRACGMGFGRIYSPPALAARVVEPATAAGLAVKIVTARMDGRELPDLTRYTFKRPAINRPLRALVLQKLATAEPG